MISPVAAATLLTAEVVAVAVWGSYVGVKSAELGPSWAQVHLQRATPVFGLTAVLGAGLAMAVDPSWLGLAVAYVGVVTWWVGRRVLRTVTQAATLGVAGELPPNRLAALLRRTSRTLALAATVVILVTVADFVWRSWPALVDLALAAALLLPAASYRRRAERLEQSVGSST